MYSEELYREWKKLYDISRMNMESRKDNKGALIEVAARHPLVDGLYPNEEFSKHLDLAMELYHKLLLSGEKVMIYVPGSLPMFEGVPDQVTLSKAGKNYLLDHGIPEEHIYSDETNMKYKGESGVYNSTDECYVACRVFEENSFGKLHCVCSSAQMMRKVLSYIRFGYVPYMHTVSCDRMFHSYIDEIFRNIPILLEDEDDLQGSSEEADCLREIRKPKA